jgi:hypothetical protein
MPFSFIHFRYIEVSVLIFRLASFHIIFATALLLSRPLAMRYIDSHSAIFASDITPLLITPLPFSADAIFITPLRHCHLACYVDTPARYFLGCRLPFRRITSGAAIIYYAFFATPFHYFIAFATPLYAGQKYCFSAD